MKSYSNDTMKVVWEMIIKDGEKIRDVAKVLDTTPDQILAILEAAKKKYGRVYIDKKPKDFIRPKAIYSNKSPMGIANPGKK